MNKIKIIAAILLMSVVSAQGMETNPYEYYYEYCTNAITSAYSYLPSWSSRSPQESEQIQALRKNKNDFEHELQQIYPKDFIQTNRTMGQLRIFISNDIYASPIKFLAYCYYNRVFLSDITVNNFLFEKCLVAQIDGYSAISAVMISPAIQIKDKSKCIKQIMLAGFTLTEKDKVLAELELYDAIPANEKEKMILFLHQKDAPLDVTKKIVDYMLEPYRLTSWLLPNSANDELSSVDFL